MGVQLPPRRDHRFDLVGLEVLAQLVDLHVEHPRPPVRAQDREGVAVLAVVAVIEAEDDRLGRQQAPVMPGVVHLLECHGVVAALRQRRDLGGEVLG